jgi:hypothetical protein
MVRRQTGHSLAGTMIFLVLVMLLWTAAGRQLACHLRADKAREMYREESTGCRRAMAWALSLLETGKPPLDSEGQCIQRMVIGDETYVVTFSEKPGHRYDVQVRPRMYSYDDLWPLVPESF